MNLDKDGRTLDQIASQRTTGSGGLSPTDTFAQTDWQNWTNTQYDIQHRRIGQSVYILIPASGTGTAGTNFALTIFGYDSLERQNRVVAPGGTITRTVWTTPQWILSIWIGTNDTGATDSNPAGSGGCNNMVRVSQNQYDNGLPGGDGNLTQQTQYASASDADKRVTSFGYDFRDRKISMTDAIGRYTVYTLDNVGRQTLVQSYAGNGGILYAQSGANYDDRSRVYQTLKYAVDPATGSIGAALIGNNWFDPSGNPIQQIAQGDGQVFTKSVFNGVNWVTSTYRGYNTTGTSYSQATTVANDIIVEQADSTFDEVGNTVSAAVSQRLNDADPTTTGALTGSIARISYVASWFDGIDRNIASANYGAISSFTRPDTPPASSATILVNLTSYDAAGRTYQATDPNGVVDQTGYDNANRTTQTIEDVGGLARTTSFTYTLDDLIATMTAVNSATGNQTTVWTYGTTLADSGVARNDLLRFVDYPDETGGWSGLTSDGWGDMSAGDWSTLDAGATNDRVAYIYNRLGEQSGTTDQRGTIRSFTLDKLGRNTHDCVTTVGEETDATVLRISRAYEVRGMVSTIISADNAAPGAGNILNQVQFSYNDFGQLIKDQQEHSGAVTDSSPSVQYGYATATPNQIRLVNLIYPNLRVIGYSFGPTGGMSDYLSRVDAIQSDGSDIAQYLYLGAGLVIRVTYPEPGVWLDLWGGTSGTFNGIDQFNRIIDQRWQNGITGAPTDIDRYQYGYDQNSNRLWKANVVGTAAVTAGLDEFYVLDPLNRLTEMQRGVLSSGKTGITGTPSVEQDWTLDPTGNWGNFITKASGSTTLNQTRTSNPVNEITNITESTGPTWIVPAYDAAGNTITMPQPASPASSFTAVYNAWNKMVSIAAASAAVGKYQYDGRGFRIVKLTYADGVLSETRQFYYTRNWQDIEERVATSTGMDQQYVWGMGYIDELICRDDPTPRRLYATRDANFNLTSISNAAGSVVERYLFDPYGTRTVMGASWSVIDSSAYTWVVGQQGLMIEVESGMIYGRGRRVNQLLGVFLGRDRAGYGDGLNLYEYEGSDPAALLDPFGLQPSTQPTTVPAPQPEVTDEQFDKALADLFNIEKDYQSPRGGVEIEVPIEVQGEVGGLRNAIHLQISIMVNDRKKWLTHLQATCPDIAQRYINDRDIIDRYHVRIEESGLEHDGRVIARPEPALGLRG